MRADGSYRKVIAKEDKVCAQLSFMNPNDIDTSENIVESGPWDPILEPETTGDTR